MRRLKARKDNAKALGFATGLCFLLLLSAPASAATHNDLVVAARALGFIENPPTGNVAVGIVYVAGVSSSVAQAENLQKLMGTGLKVGSLTLKPVLVKVEDLSTADVRLFFLTEGIGDNGPKVAAAVAAKRIPCITVDLEQVRNGACVIGVRSSPKVEILVNRAAAEKSGTAFPAVFRMMITEF
jgi:hypothetical protein